MDWHATHSHTFHTRHTERTPAPQAVNKRKGKLVVIRFFEILLLNYCHSPLLHSRSMNRRRFRRHPWSAHTGNVCDDESWWTTLHPAHTQVVFSLYAALQHTYRRTNTTPPHNQATKECDENTPSQVWRKGNTSLSVASRLRAVENLRQKQRTEKAISLKKRCMRTARKKRQTKNSTSDRELFRAKRQNKRRRNAQRVCGGACLRNAFVNTWVRNSS